MIDWTKAQAKLGVRADGIAGPRTYGTLLAVAAGRAQDAATTSVAVALAENAASYAVTTPARLAEFVAQIANETGGFKAFEEDLRYRASTMLAQWPKHFTPAQAAAAVGHPVEIASRAYGGRMGNAPYPSTDGYTYRGRGALQLTGRSAYAKFGAAISKPLIAHPELAADPGVSTVVALEFFKQLGVFAAVDAGDFVRARKLTNGGDIGLENVARIRARLLRVLL